MVNIQNLKDESLLPRLLVIKTIKEKGEGTKERFTLFGIGTIADAEQLMTRFPMRISQVAERVGLSNWNYVDQLLIKQVVRETGFKMKDSNNESVKMQIVM